MKRFNDAFFNHNYFIIKALNMALMLINFPKYFFIQIHKSPYLEKLNGKSCIIFVYEPN